MDILIKPKHPTLNPKSLKFYNTLQHPEPQSPARYYAVNHQVQDQLTDVKLIRASQSAFAALRGRRLGDLGGRALYDFYTNKILQAVLWGFGVQ